MKALVIGKFQKAFGIKGYLKTEFYTDGLDDLDAFSAFYIRDRHASGGMRPFRFEDIHDQGSKIVCKIDICPDRTTAEGFHNVEILVDEAELPQIDEDEFYIKDLMNCRAYNQEELLGTIVNVVEVAGQHILFIQTGDKKELALPFQDDRLEKVDIENKLIVFKDINGLL